MVSAKSLLNDPERRRSSVKAAIAALPTSKKPDVRHVSLEIPDSVWSYVHKAAVSREIQPGSYLRRAAYAMLAYDLGIPVTELFERDPGVTRYTGAKIQDPQGTKFGSWQIEEAQGDG